MIWGIWRSQMQPTTAAPLLGDRLPVWSWRRFAFTAGAKDPQLVAFSFDPQILFDRRKPKSGRDAIFQHLHVPVLELDDLITIKADKMIVIGPIDEIRIVELVVLTEIHLAQHP